MAANAEPNVDPLEGFLPDDFLEGECPPEEPEEPLPLLKYPIVTEDGFGFNLLKSDNQACGEGSSRTIDKVVKRYTMTNQNGVSVQIIDYGSTIVSIRCPDKDGVFDDVVLGFETIDEYQSKNNQYFGATIGRVAGIITNAEYTIREKPVYLTNNLGDHHFHGGFVGFDKVMWESYEKDGRVVMSYTSEDGTEGYPGNVMVQISYYLTLTNYLIVEITANASKPTPLSITNHSYFNLAGHGEGINGLKEHCLVVNADKYMVADVESGVPTGELKDVGGTYYDLRVPRSLEKALQCAPGDGYDHTFCLTKGSNQEELTFAARLVHPKSGRYLEITTDYPGLHVYTANRLPDPGKPYFLLSWITDYEKFFEPGSENDRFGLEGGWEPIELCSSSEIRCKSHLCRCGKSPVCEDSQTNSGEVSEEGFEDDDSDEEDSEKDIGDEDPYFVKECSCSYWEDDERRSLALQNPAEPEPPTACEDFLVRNRDDAESDTEEELMPVVTNNEPIKGKMGFKYTDRCAICLMPQEYPDAINHRRFPNPIVYPGRPYSRTIKYKIGLVRQRAPSEIEEILGEEGEGEGEF